jgi:23S rRNA pseudouridine2605 synthase
MLERLQKIISRAGIASRRHAEELILSGQVRVNGKVVTALGAKADPERDRVEAAGRVAQQPAGKSYFILNKPVHVVSTMFDPEGRATLRHVLRGLSGAIFPVAGLEYAASGLMLLTSDGELADRIFKNVSRIPQVFWLKVAGKLTDDEMQEIRRRAHARLRQLRAPGAASSRPQNPWYEAEITDPSRDLLRRTLFGQDHPVEKMKRVKFGPLELGHLPDGHYRRLDPREAAHLQRFVEQTASAKPKPISGAKNARRASHRQRRRENGKSRRTSP